jgi:hypothetical protein
VPPLGPVSGVVASARQGATDRDFWLAYSLVLLTGGLSLFLLALAEPSLRHWFLIPVGLCLAVVGWDTAGVVSGRVPAFSPLGLFGLLGVQFFFAAPVLHVYLDYWMNYTVGPSDWRPWLGGMAALNLLGLLAAHCGRRVPGPRRGRAGAPPWTLQPAVFFPLGGAILVVSLILQLWTYARFGGVTGYVEAYMLGQITGDSPFEGWGRVMMVAELFPIVALMLVAGHLKLSGRRPSLLAIALLLVVFFFFCLYFGGLRGSRSNTVWMVFWAVMLVHVWLRPIPKRLLALAVAALAAFMYFYGLYKGMGGGEGLVEVLEGRTTLAELEERTEKPIEKVLLVDFGRGDIQALILQRIATGAFEPVWGRTYLAGLAMLVPRALWPERPPSKVREGSEIRFGAGAFEGRRVSWFVHGLAGEAMINFGPLGVLPAFLLYGILLAGLHRFVTGLDPGDARVLLAPVAVILAIVLLTSDLDNVLWFTCKAAAIPALFVYLSTRQPASRRRSARLASG